MSVFRCRLWTIVWLPAKFQCPRQALCTGGRMRLAYADESWTFQYFSRKLMGWSGVATHLDTLDGRALVQRTHAQCKCTCICRQTNGNCGCSYGCADHSCTFMTSTFLVSDFVPEANRSTNGKSHRKFECRRMYKHSIFIFRIQMWNFPYLRHYWIFYANAKGQYNFSANQRTMHKSYQRVRASNIPNDSMQKLNPWMTSNSPIPLVFLHSVM